MSLEIVTIPCLADNYAFLLHDQASKETAVIDAPDAAPIRATLDSRGWTLSHILLTHHHWDHIDGADELRSAYGAKICGAAADAHRLPQLDCALTEGDFVTVGGEKGTIMDVPGHTIGHIAFYFPGSRAVFTADSLMVLGCGRLFEGTPRQMWASLCKLAALPPETRVYSGHEYTEANARFALTIEPDNAALLKRYETIQDMRRSGQPTIPSTLAEELATNPFLRSSEPQVKAAVGMDGAPDVEVFAEIRRRKDNF